MKSHAEGHVGGIVRFVNESEYWPRDQKKKHTMATTTAAQNIKRFLNVLHPKVY